MYINDGDQLEQELIGPRVPTEAMSRGTAFHSMIENGTARYFTGTVYQVLEPELGIEWEWSQKEANEVERLRAKYPGMIHEMKEKVLFQIDGTDVVMNLRLDALYLNTVLEFKTKSSTPSYMEYFNSVQWRCYLVAVPDCSQVRYHVFQFNTKNEVAQTHEFLFLNDGSCEDFINRELRGFINWAKTRPKVWAWLEARAGNK